MRKSSTLFLSTGLTAFALVLVLGVAWELNRPTVQTSAAAGGAAAGVQQPLPAPAASQPGVSAVNANRITPQDALRIAMRALPNSTLRRGPELVDYQGTMAYAMQLSGGVVVVDATSGDVLLAGGLGRSGDRQPGSRIEGRSAQNDIHEFGDDSD